MGKGPIGIFDSGYGGLTVLKEIAATLPRYDYIYLGDNARTPYGTRSFETVYQIVILACNTASAKALRTIQQNDLPEKYPSKRVLGIIRPTTEIIGRFTKKGSVGILGTTGTVLSNSYPIEIEKFFPGITVYQEACPMWVPLVENNEYNSPGADFFIQKNINRLLAHNKDIDVILLACTHYPLLLDKIKQFVPPGTVILSQAEIVGGSLDDYLKRHTEIAEKCTQNSSLSFYTTDSTDDFDNHAAIFFGKPVRSIRLNL